MTELESPTLSAGDIDFMREWCVFCPNSVSLLLMKNDYRFGKAACLIRKGFLYQLSADSAWAGFKLTPQGQALYNLLVHE